MGAPHFHLAGLAALPRRLARQIRAHPLGLRRNHPPPGPARAHRPDRQQRASEKHARKVLSKANALSKNVRFHRWPTNRVWTRDSGCTFVVSEPTPHLSSRAKQDRSLANDPSQSRDLLFDANLSAVKWRFNAWAKYPNYQHDEKIGSRMAKAANAEEIRPVHGKSRVVLEGGSIDVNGRGTLLTTEECLLSKTQQRNPAMSRADYEKLFSDFLGITNVIWLDSGIAGDDTHGHVDDITRFVSPDTVVTAVESDPDDPNYEPLRENIGRLRAATDQDGNPLAIVELPMPGPVVFERPPPPRQLRQLLHRQRNRAGPGLQRSQRPCRSGHPGRSVSRPRSRRHLFRRLNLGIRGDALHDAAATEASRQSSVFGLQQVKQLRDCEPRAGEFLIAES